MQNWKCLKFQRFWFPVILYSGIIFYVSSVPNISTPLPEMHFDKILHILLYAPFGFLVARGIYNTKASVSYRKLLDIVFWASLLYGLSDEVHQMYVPGRNIGFIDLVADTVGGVIGGYIYTIFVERLKNKVN